MLGHQQKAMFRLVPAVRLFGTLKHATNILKVSRGVVYYLEINFLLLSKLIALPPLSTGDLARGLAAEVGALPEKVLPAADLLRVLLEFEACANTVP